uniref:c-type cytochrome n=1 Tax=Hydrogenophaga borbori TaxID=2294117 RepID=UPI003B01107C
MTSDKTLRAPQGPRAPFWKGLLLAATLALPGLAAQAAETLPTDPMARRMLACVACHGQDGRATNQGYFPRIAGKPAGYLYHQLQHFRAGRRINPTMTYLVD